jgi:hypothetical protein
MIVDVPTDSAVITTDVIIDSSTDSKRESRLDQLSKARDSLKQKKRQRDEDISDMKQKLDSISDSLKATTTKSETIPEIEQVKRQRVTKVVEDVHDAQDESWSTSLIRTTAVVSLGAISWYMQNMYGNSKARPPLESSFKKKNENETKTPQTTMLSVRDKISTAIIGRSGFVS